MTEPASGPGSLILADGAVAARVRLAEDGHATALLLTQPGRPLAEVVGETISVDIPTQRGLLHVAARVADAPSGELLELDVVGEPELIQRRAFLRVEAFVPVLVQALDQHGATVDTRTLDLGGGGALIARLNDFDLASVTHLTLRFPDDSPPIVTDATVVRDAGDGRRGVRFEAMDEREHDRLVRFVFERERIARSRRFV